MRAILPDHIRMYLVSEDYVPRLPGLPDDAPSLAIRRHVLTSTGKIPLILGLGVLGTSLLHGQDSAQMKVHIDLVAAALTPESRVRFRNAMTPGDQMRWPLARQPLLAAVRSALKDGTDMDSTTMDPVVAAFLFENAVGTTLYEDRGGSEQKIAGLPADLAVHLVVNHFFNATEDTAGLLDRTIRLWRDYGPGQAHRLYGGLQPTEILEQATGIEVEDFLAMAFAVWSFHMAWEPGKPIALNSDLHEGAPL